MVILVSAAICLSGQYSFYFYNLLLVFQLCLEITLKVWKTALLNVVQDCSKICEDLVTYCELERRVGIKQQREMKSKVG